MAQIGYARVSTADQDPAMQVTALKEAGAERVFEEHASGAKTERPQLSACLDYLREGDTLVVWKLDRLGRSLAHLLAVVNGLHDRGVHFKSITEGFDTATPGGTMIFHVLGALAEMERGLIQERTRAGLTAARARGKVGGRRTVMTPAKTRSAKSLIDAGTPLSEVAHSLGVGRATIYRWLEREQEKAAA